jgi:hypothetical protein
MPLSEDQPPIPLTGAIQTPRRQLTLYSVGQSRAQQRACREVPPPGHDTQVFQD